ncbi:hypothetical protein BP6252_11800 [Coleophoma cylindrospora]|uniref:Uncharacterized protein n=1 Tax=Coleophoma cylindrospora TaxID=1849047 RepID=A0A3D8QKV4_9HELO|nr:hypothetical protein BP6252_11800 [Coleophoma cylindrospora]
MAQEVAPVLASSERPQQPVSAARALVMSRSSRIASLSLEGESRGHGRIEGSWADRCGLQEGRGEQKTRRIEGGAVDADVGPRELAKLVRSSAFANQSGRLSNTGADDGQRAALRGSERHHEPVASHIYRCHCAVPTWMAVGRARGRRAPASVEMPIPRAQIPAMHFSTSDIAPAGGR